MKTFVARVRYADAVLDVMASPDNEGLYKEILTKSGIPITSQHIPLYTIEIALGACPRIDNLLRKS